MRTITTIGLDIAKSVNAAGLAGLRNLKSPGAGSKLTARQRAELAELVEATPMPRCTGSCVGGGSICAMAATLNDQREAVHAREAAVAQFRRTRRQNNVRPGHARGLIRALVAPGGQDFILGMLDECGAVAAASHRSVVPATKNLCLSHAVRRPLQHQPRLSESW